MWVVEIRTRVRQPPQTLKIFYQFVMFEGSQGTRVEAHTLTLEQLDNRIEVTIAVKAKQIPWKPRNQKEVLFNPLVIIMLRKMVHTRCGWFSHLLRTVGFGSSQNFKESLGSLEIIWGNSSNHWLQACYEKWSRLVLGGSLSLSLSLSLSFGGEPSTSVFLKTLENHIGSLKFLIKKINLREPTKG